MNIFGNVSQQLLIVIIFEKQRQFHTKTAVTLHPDSNKMIMHTENYLNIDALRLAAGVVLLTP